MPVFNPGQKTMKSLKLLLRFLTVGGLVLLLLIPLSLIRGAIHERQSYRAEAVQRVARNTAGAQQFIGPLRVVPWTDTQVVAYTDDDGTPKQRVERTTGQVLQMPKKLSVTGNLVPNQLKAGLYQVSVYDWHANLTATFEAALPAPAANVTREYGIPYLAFGISDVRGLRGSPSLRADGKPLRLESGTRDLTKRFNGMHAMLPAVAGGTVEGAQVTMSFVLKGTQSLSVAPVGDDNSIAIDSAWRHPKFDGYSPRSEISDQGFKANWEISSLASNVQAQLRAGLDGKNASSDSSRDNGAAFDGASMPSIDSMQVSLVDPIDIYTQVDRASKYGILFVVLTFVGFGLLELIKRLPIHPLQYLLVGLALAIFFLLLLSLSEHIDFLLAYLISSGACIGLQFVYLSGVLKSWLRASGFAVMLTSLYGVLYGLLISEDNALLMGSLLLFGILAAIMWITRKVDWYELGSSLR
jgi:inner membrane protein